MVDLHRSLSFLKKKTPSQFYNQDMESVNGAPNRRKDWVVQKYGGTSIGKFPKEIVDIICNELNHNRLAIVCSARSSGIKAEGTTTK